MTKQRESLSAPIGGAALITTTINGDQVEQSVQVRTSLADFLRSDLGLTGTHLGCEHGVCGACTVIVDGEPMRSCLMLAVQADGSSITTIEGLAETDDDGEIVATHPIQQALHDAHGFQCAFCAPGFLMTALCLLQANPTPSRDEIRSEISGNLCRCTGYHSIIDGIETAVVLMANDQNDQEANGA